MLPPDILIKRLNAHLNYLYPRVLKENKRNEFEQAIRDIIGNIRSGDEFGINLGFDRHGGVKMAVEVLNDIVKTTDERFVTGRSGDFYMEKL
jgi:hypothetical protein